LLLEHCDRFDRLHTRRAAAGDRLERVLGPDLARFLCRALVHDEATVRRPEDAPLARQRRSFSP